MSPTLQAETDWEVYLAANIHHFFWGKKGWIREQSQTLRGWSLESWVCSHEQQIGEALDIIQEALDPRSRKSPWTQNKGDGGHVPRKITGLLWTTTTRCLQLLSFSNRSLYCIFSVPVSPLCIYMAQIACGLSLQAFTTQEAMSGYTWKGIQLLKWCGWCGVGENGLD